MESVSLLPPEITKEKTELRKRAVLVRMLFYLLIVAIAVNAYLLASTLLTRSDLNALRREREIVEQQAEALREYADLFADMNRAEETLNTAMGTVPDWSELFSDVGLTLPPTASLSDMTVNYSEEEESGSLAVSGWTFSHEHVAQMLDRIYTLEQLDDIRIRVSSGTTIGGRDAVQFTVDAVLLPGEKYLQLDEGDREDGN